MTLRETLLSLLEASLTPSPTVFILGFAIVLLVPIALHFILHSSTPYNTLPSVLLIGPSGAGKTSLQTLFERGTSTAPTHTSQVPSSVELAAATDSSVTFRDDLDALGAEAKKFLLVDTPGHAKLRRHALSKILPTASSESSQSKLKAVVFVVDAAALADGDALPATAGYLYDVLLALQKRMSGGRGSKAPPSVPVLIAANKLDLFTALPAALVKSNLEAELGRVRKTRSKGLLDSSVAADEQGEETDDWLGEYGSEKFSFKQLLEFDIEVDVIGGNVVGEGPGADKWWKWIAERV
ncbi:hypothetical protein OQA88_9382 [Cercophora sp. LCS_1]